MKDLIRTKWAAVGAAVAITLGAGGVSLTQAAITSGDKPVTVSLTEPCRLVDTRPATQIGPKDTPIAAGEANAYEIQVTGANGNCTGGLAVPGDAVAVALNVTAIAPEATTTGRSFFTVYPADASLPTTSNVNFLDGAPPTPNKVDVGLSGDGKIKIYNNEGTAHAAVDIFGYYIDHDHDDRYYTEDEVDAALATKDNGEAAGAFEDVDTLATDTTPKVLASTTVDTPSRGYVTANASFSGYGFGEEALIECSITNGNNVDATNSFRTHVPANKSVAMAGTRLWSVPLVPVSGETTLNLVCLATGDNLVSDINMTAVFTPDPDAVPIIVLP